MFQAITRGLILALCVTFHATLAEAQQYAAVVMDARSGKVLHARNADARLHPASLTKMMTLYIVFDELRRGRLSLEQRVRISANAAAEPPSKLGLRAGQEIELRYLIRAAAIKSANDAATALGEAVAGSEAAFTQRMTQYARAMGMSNTSFRNAHGLTAEGHLSSARDMALLGRRLMYDFPQYYNIFSRNSTSAGIKTVQNTNRRLLDAYPGADGIKTGYTRAAGFNLVSSAERGGKRVIVALFGGKSSASRNAEVARLMDLGFAQMPARARFAAMPPLQLAAAQATAPIRPAVAPAGSTAGIVAAAVAAEPPERVAQPTASLRPLPRRLMARAVVTRGTDSIAEAIAEVNADLSARGSDAEAGLVVAAGRPVARPGMPGAAVAAPSAAPAQSASTFAVVAAAEPLMRSDAEIESVAAPAGSTGGPGWGVQLGAYRSRGDAERQLLTTALRDLPDLAGGLRRIEAVKLQGVTVYRAQFVGLSEVSAQGACASLERVGSDCLPLQPGS
jgi:D-alanyl-D-alanine carboxypeptidase